MPTPSLDHIEKTFADGYRKEIDQEENIWRSLPFFAATLALQLAALVGVTDRLPPLDGPTRPWMLGLLLMAGGCTVLALAGMAAAIYPLRFAYLSSEPELLDYVRRLEEAERANPPGEAASPVDTSPDDAITALKIELARQYAAATHRNRRINQRRALFRSMSGLCMLLSVLSILVLVAVTVGYHVVARGTTAVTPARGEQGDAATQQGSSGTAAPSDTRGGARPTPTVRSHAPADARGDERLDHQPGAPGIPGTDRGR